MSESGTDPEEPQAPKPSWRNLPKRLYDWVLHWADTPYAVTALVLLSMAEASFFPIPPDVLLIAMCLAAIKKSFRFALYCTLASVVGGLLGYGIGALVWGGVDQIFYDFIPGFTPDRFEQVRGLYHEYGVWIVFTAGFTPIPFKLFTVTSGVMALPLGPFLLAAAVGRAGRFFLVAAMIFFFGDRVKKLTDKYFNLLIILFTVLLIGGFAVVKWLF